MIMYLCPALMDWLLFYIVFAVLYSAGIRGLSIWECALLGVIMQVAYMPFSVVAGWLLKPSNARRMLIWSTVALGALSVACLTLKGFWPLMASLAAFGIGSAFFFNAFQTFMRSSAALGSALKIAVSKYNFAWSVGAGAGCLTAGLIYELGTLALVVTAIASALAVLATIVLYSEEPDGASAARDGEIEEGGSPKARPVAPIYVAIGWIMIFSAQFVQRPLCTFLPPLFAGSGISSTLASLPLFAMLGVQAGVALVMWRFRDHLYRRTSLWIVQAAAALAFVMIWLWPHYLVCLVLLLLIGVYCGFIFFSAIYYVSNSKKSSFNIGVNEALVGLGSISGVFAGDAWMRYCGSGPSVYLMCAAGLLVALLLQVLLATFWNKRPEPKP